MRIFLSLMGILLVGCQAVPVNVGNPNLQALRAPVVSYSSGEVADGIIPMDGIGHISFHADRKLRMNKRPGEREVLCPACDVSFKVKF